MVPDSLYAVRYDGELMHELAKLFDLWRDMEYLENFFTCHHADLNQFWGHLTAKEAARATKDEARRLEQRLFDLAGAGNSRTDDDNLSVLFKPLGTTILRPGELEKCKARGATKKSWLRIYAVRLNVNEFVISGGAIKLTKTMNERPHLLKELEKLERVRRYVREDLNDEFGFFELL